jgi:hypothetical protein
VARVFATQREWSKIRLQGHWVCAEQRNNCQTV